MYRAGLPDDSVNTSLSNPLLTALKLAISLLLIVAVAYAALNYLIDITVSSISPEQEARLEKMFVVEANLSDANSSELSRITQRMARCAKLPYPIYARIMEKPEPNAFAVPGGLIYITRGMLKKIKSENALAFIIGHELGHFKHRDHLRGLGYRLILGMVGLLLGSDYGAATQITLGIGSAKHSQSAEFAADAFGLEMMQCAYGTVTDATTLFEEMDTGDEWHYFMATHPGFRERVERMKAQILRKHFDTIQKPIPLKKL